MHYHARPHLLALLCVAAVTAALARPASAQATDTVASPAKAPAVEVTPFFALGDDLAPGFGGAITFPWTRQFSVEAEAGYGADATRSSVSLLYGIPGLRRFGTYVAGGVGVQRDEFEALEPALGFVTRKKTEFAVNIGAGLTFPVSSRWGYRVDFRWYNPKDEWPESWRVYNGLTFGLRKADGGR
jgi:opacity protein-like surface antigen